MWGGGVGVGGGGGGDSYISQRGHYHSNIYTNFHNIIVVRDCVEDVFKSL